MQFIQFAFFTRRSSNNIFMQVGIGKITVSQQTTPAVAQGPSLDLCCRRDPMWRDSPLGPDITRHLLTLLQCLPCSNRLFQIQEHALMPEYLAERRPIDDSEYFRAQAHEP